MKHITLISGMAFAVLFSLSFLFNHVPVDVNNRHPGAEEYDKMLTEKITQMKIKRGQDYKPRTKHLLPGGEAKYTNRLFLESSPYLLQHAHNPVNWFPWGEEAFNESKRLNRPIFISIGYSTCHWCHVMEEESFEDEEIAGFINSHYIPIKVDREERPDVDSIYMAAAQIINGNGGWPLNVWLTPDLKPFYAGTYFPPRNGDRGASTGFLTILDKLSETYKAQPELIAKSSRQLTQYIQQALIPESGNALPDMSIADKAVERYENVYDPEYGGIQGAPKFPSSLNARLLFRQYKRKHDTKALKMATHSLEKMADGGMYDHIGGGFHRYSTDRMWLAPHFEKMLYDNALLAITYLEAWQVTKTDRFRIITKEILDYVHKEMTSENGGFYSATDADTLTPEGEKEEGYFFTWTPEELEAILGAEKKRIVEAYYSVEKNPNFEGRHILHITKNKTELAALLRISVETLEKEIQEAKQILYKERNKREKPFTDTKILTSWNGLMISAFARAGLLLDNPTYTQAAIKAARLISDKLFIDGRLFRSYKDDKAKHIAYLDDYAFLSASFIDLYEATFEIDWLKKAIVLDSVLEADYEDPENGGFFMTSSDHENLLAREKPTQDGALPSGNSVAVLNMLRLYSFTSNTKYLNRAEKALESISEQSQPIAISEMILTLDYYHDLPKEIIIVTPKGKPEEAEPYLNELRKQYIPNRILSVVSEGEHLKTHAEVVPLLSGKIAINGKTMVYLCKKGVCQLPSKTPEDFSKMIGEAWTDLDSSKIN